MNDNNMNDNNFEENDGFDPSVYYVWLGAGSDNSLNDNCCSGVYKALLNEEFVSGGSCTCQDSTEQQMLFSVMVDAMRNLPRRSKVVFMTYVPDIQRIKKIPLKNDSNADLINDCRKCFSRHKSVSVVVVPYDAYPIFDELHQQALKCINDYREDIASDNGEGKH